MANQLNVPEFYQGLDTSFPFRNDGVQYDHAEYAQFNTIITNRLFTPDHHDGSGAADPEDLQIRVSRKLKFFVGSNDAASNLDYSLAISDSDTQTILDTTKEKMSLNADYLELNSLTLHDTLGAAKLSSEKALQIHSTNKTQFVGNVEFDDQVKTASNVYVGSSVIFQQKAYGGESNDQVRIAMQYNQARDTLDIVKQHGTGVETKKRLMARLGIGGVMGNTTELADIPFYNSPPIAASYDVNGPVFDAQVVWKQNNNTLHFGTSNVNGTPEFVGIGTSNVENGKILQVVGETKFNNIRIDEQNNLTGVNIINADTVSVQDLNIAAGFMVRSNADLETVNLTSINFKNNVAVNAFNGTLSTLQNDLYPWLNSDPSQVNISLFNNDANFITNIDSVPVKKDGKWRFKEDSDDLIVEKYDGSSWITKFRFTA
tara:strand:- start:644 stop:1933 length:1290 start_codon:yes stop_codon:yes gene_type:complete